MSEARRADIVFGVLGFGCFVWGTVRHFARVGTVPAGAQFISFASLLAFGHFLAAAARAPELTSGLVCVMFACALGLWAWAIAYTRSSRPALAFSDDEPRVLFTGGPYRWLRHPFYSAYLLYWCATALAAGDAAGWAACAGLAFLYWRAARFEERKFARSPWATAYQDYARSSFFHRRTRRDGKHAMQPTRVCGLPTDPLSVKALGVSGRAIETGACDGPNQRAFDARPRFAAIRTSSYFISRFVRDCSLTPLPEVIAQSIRTEQVNSLSTLIGVMSLMGMGTVPLVLYEFRDGGLHGGLLPLCAFIAACYVNLIVMSLGWNFGWQGMASDAERVLRRFVAVCTALGIAWGVLFVRLMGDAHDDRRAILYALVIALMSAGVLVAPPSAAFAFWIPVTAAGLFAVTFGAATRDASEILLLSGYAALTLFCILYLNRALIRRALGEIEQHEGRETIGLLLRDFEESACDWLWETDQDGRLTYVSQRFAQAARVNSDGLLGRNLTSFLQAQDRLPAEPSRRLTDRPSLLCLMQRRLPFRDVEVSLQIEGDTVWWSLTGKPKFSNRQEFGGYRGVGSDVTQARRANDRARFLAHYDDLTGLANRRLFREVVEAHAQTSHAMALLCLDLDRFKAVNDTHGHPAGDALLIAVSRRLQAFLGPHDFCARLGGDEFAVVAEDPAEPAVAALAQSLVADLSKPYHLGELVVEIGVSVGVTIATPDVASSLAILREADAALYQAKADGRGTVRFYDSELSSRDARRRAMQQDLRFALDRNELSLDFQPIFNLGEGRVSTVEALVRWDRGAQGTVLAEAFVPMAESFGLIDDLGEWVLAEACVQAGRLPDDVRLAVNVSPLQLNGRRFIAHLCRVLAQTGLAPDRLELELTETAFFDMSEETLAMLEEVRRMGVRINLDDFGVGHTSLGQLRRFTFSTLKIDRSFVQDLPSNTGSRIIVRGLATMAAELGIRTTAEGVETAEQLSLVREAGCNDAQGFLLARPMALPAVLRLIDGAGPAALLKVMRSTMPSVAAHAEMFN